MEPLPRYASDGFTANKSCPCGEGPNDQRCGVGSANSDPNRSVDRVNVYQAGDDLTVRLHEVVGHSGRWRIAFDPDGADLADFNANILLDVPDPSGSDGNVGQGDLWEFQVTLPDTPCDRCTLQVLQIMNGDTVDPVPDPTGMSSYFQCADLELLGDGATDTATTPPGIHTGGGTTPTTETGDPGTTDPTPPTTTGGDDTGPVATDIDTEAGADDGGCGCDAGAGAHLPGAVVAVGLLLARRRRPARPGGPRR